MNVTKLIQWATHNSLMASWGVVSINGTTCIGPQMDKIPRGDIPISPAQLGVLTGIFIALFINFKIRSNEQVHKDYNEILNFIRKSNFPHFSYHASCFIGFIFLSPILLFLMCCFWLYREIIRYSIKAINGESFQGFLEGTDTVWALEEDSHRSVINIFGNITVPLYSEPIKILDRLRTVISGKLLTINPQPFPKLWYKRRSEMGYYFWTNENDNKIEDFIKLMDNPDGMDLKEELAFLSNKILPYEHSSSWELLLGRKSVSQYSSTTLELPVLFRVHHTLGDGISLLRFFMEAIADENLNLKTSNKQIIPVQKKLSTFVKILKKLKIFLTAPGTLFHVSVLRRFDENFLHGPELSGGKVLSWLFEEDDNCDLIGTIKAIKRKIPGGSFSDVLLAALAGSLKNYFNYKEKYIPHDVTIVVPARVDFDSWDEKVKLQNRFSVALQTIPIESGSTMLYHRVGQVKELSDIVKNSPDYQVNYFVMSFLASLLPEFILKPVMFSAHSTLVMSNVPGPIEKISINGYEIKNMAFLVPHRGTTGIGLSVFSYRGKMQFGLIADKSLIQTSEDLDFILGNIEDELMIMKNFIRCEGCVRKWSIFKKS